MAIKEKKKKGIYDGLPYFMAIKEKKKKGISPDLHGLRQSRKIFEKCLKKTKFRRGLSATSSSVRGPNSEIPFYDIT
jgi:hypothetical protein